MKNKLLLTVLTLTATTAGVWAAPISPENALERVQNSGNLTLLNSPIKTRSLHNPELKMTLKADDGLEAVYIFDYVNDKGFMVVSADDSTTPLLGYSDSGSFDPDNIPPALSYWLSQYQRQIEYSRTHQVATRSADTRAGVSLPSSWKVINPLVKTTWNQGTPYNNLCPEYKGSLCVTGCVATSVAQAMKYHNWPSKGSGSVSYETSTYGMELSLNFATVTFDWNNMIDSYEGSYTTTQANAVATLMKAVGYGVEMNYTPNESGAASTMVPYALVNYFNYDAGIRYYARNQFTYTEWATMLYDNLQKVGPVVYDGTGSAGGHSWICDGYSGNGYFHFNWGWGGISDGNFLLDALDPSSLGIGGGAGGFNFDQGALFNMKPATSSSTSQIQNEIVLSDGIKGSIASGSSMLSITTTNSSSQSGWIYQGSDELVFELGVGYVKADTPNATPNYASTGELFSLSGGYLVPAIYNGSPVVQINLNNKNLEKNVKYKFFSAYKPQNSNTWLEVSAPVGFPNYCYVTYNGLRYTVTNENPMEFAGTSASFDKGLYYGSATQLSATISNPNNTELTRGVQIVLLATNGKTKAFIGDTFLVTLPANGSETYTWDTALTKQTTQNEVTAPTQFYIALYDYETGAQIYKSANTVTMNPAIANLSLDVSITVNGINKDPNNNQVDVYNITNPSNIPVVTKISVEEGYFADSVTLGIFTPTSDGYASLTESYSLSNGYLFMNEGDSQTWNTNVSLASAKVGDRYYLGALDSKNSPLDNQPLHVVLLISEDSGVVESLEVDNTEIRFLVDRVSGVVNVIGGENGIANVDVYFLNGMKVNAGKNISQGRATLDLSALGKGVVLVTATDAAGHKKSVKLAL